MDEHEDEDKDTENQLNQQTRLLEVWMVVSSHHQTVPSKEKHTD